MDLLNNEFKAPLYIQIESLIENKIVGQEYLPGERLPGERELASTYGVNRMTVKRAINNLVSRGFLIRKQGSGTYVKSHGIGDKYYFDLAFTNEQSNAGISELLAKNGIKVSNQILGREMIVRSHFLAKKLGLSADDEIFGLHRVRNIDNEPFAVEYNYLPGSLFANAMEIDFQTIGLYDYMNSKGAQPRHVYQRIQTLRAMEKEATLLQVDKGDWLYLIQYQSADQKGRLVEYTESFLNPEKVNLKFTVVKPSI